MFKKIAVLAPLLGLLVFAGGCCCVQPCATGVSCDPCGDMGSGCGDSCEQPCDPCATTCCPTPCCGPSFLLAPLHWVGGLFHGACCCDSGCGELYWGGWHNYPPRFDPCNRCGEWVGDAGCGCYEGCSSPTGGCAECQTCQSGTHIPVDAKLISRTDQQVASATSPAGDRIPTKASPRPVKKSPQARRPYYARPRR